VEQPEQLVEQPEQLVEQPEQLVEQPEQLVEQPEQLVEQPEQLVEQPEQPRTTLQEALRRRTTPLRLLAPQPPMIVMMTIQIMAGWDCWVWPV
jgi:hypothetical protein